MVDGILCQRPGNPRLGQDDGTQERLFMRILIVLLAFAAFNLLTLTTPDTARQNLAAWTTLAGRR